MSLDLNAELAHIDRWLGILAWQVGTLTAIIAAAEATRFGCCSALR